MTTTTNTVDKDFLQFYRLKSGLTQAELKKMAGYPNIGKVERGNVVLSNDDASDKAAIKRIAKALKIRPEQLLCLDERAAAENSAANKFASLNLCAMRNARQSSHKEVGVSLGFHEKNAGVLVFEFECGRRIFPPDELTRIAADIFGESAESHEKQKEFLAREFTAAEIVYIYSGTETNRENEAKKFEETDIDVPDAACISAESEDNAEYELHLTDGRVVPIKGSRNSIDVAYEFYIARKKVMLEYVKVDGSIFICRKKDIFYITRKGDER
ncbi:MAG: helix-turn-helix transcriptional regulator [Ruminococcaceae bacterium]|nr:helix-turn-helix transcriptional regulator [Oscillospiraceae bacterium]